MITKQSPWGLWWLTMVTFTIYYFAWYGRINKELCAVLGEEVPVDGKWFATIVPVLNIVGLAKTAGRVNAAHAKVGSTTRVSVGMTFLSALWFASATRYLQRRINVLHDVLASHAAQSVPAPVSPAPTAQPAPQVITQSAPAETTAPEAV